MSSSVRIDLLAARARTALDDPYGLSTVEWERVKEIERSSLGADQEAALRSYAIEQLDEIISATRADGE